MDGRESERTRENLSEACEAGSSRGLLGPLLFPSEKGNSPTLGTSMYLWLLSHLCQPSEKTRLACDLFISSSTSQKSSYTWGSKNKNVNIIMQLVCSPINNLKTSLSGYSLFFLWLGIESRALQWLDK